MQVLFSEVSGDRGLFSSFFLLTQINPGFKGYGKGQTNSLTDPFFSKIWFFAHFSRRYRTSQEFINPQNPAAVRQNSSSIRIEQGKVLFYRTDETRSAVCRRETLIDSESLVLAARPMAAAKHRSLPEISNEDGRQECRFSRKIGK